MLNPLTITSAGVNPGGTQENHTKREPDAMLSGKMIISRHHQMACHGCLKPLAVTSLGVNRGAPKGITENENPTPCFREKWPLRDIIKL